MSRFFVYLLVAVLSWMPVFANAASATFTANTSAELQNPERGFYMHLVPGSEWCNGFLQTVRDGGNSLDGVGNHQPVRLMFYDWYPPGTSPATVDADLACARAGGVKVIFSASYCTGAPCSEGVTIGTMLSQVASIKSTLYKYRDVLYSHRCGYLGGWGQWVNSSALATVANKLALWNACLSATPPEIPIIIQYPYDPQAWFGGQALTPTTAFTGSPLARMMWGNDCFMSSDNDVWTFPGPISYLDTVVTSSADNQRAYWIAQSQYMGTKSETCEVGGVTPRLRCYDSLNDNTNRSGGIMNEGPRYHLSSDHRGYWSGFHLQWIADGCYPQVNNLMGYRFQYDSIIHADTMTRGSINTFTITMHNYGWARIMSLRQVRARLVRAAASDITCTFTPQLRTLPSQSSVSVGLQSKCLIPNNATVGSYAVYLEMPDVPANEAAQASSGQKQFYMIQPANANNGGQIWDATNRRFATGTNVTVN